MESRTGNGLLNAPSVPDFELLQPQLNSGPLVQGHRLLRRAKRSDERIFGCGGSISVVVVLADGETVETGMVGRDGVAGASAVLTVDARSMRRLPHTRCGIDVGYSSVSSDLRTCRVASTVTSLPAVCKLSAEGNLSA